MKAEPPRRVVVAVSGASGAGYARLLLEVLVTVPVEVALVISPTASEIIATELDLPAGDLLAGLAGGERVQRYAPTDFGAPFASGSNVYDAMAIVPASQGLIGRIAHGISDCLMTRAADVCLKERRPLIIVPREMPLSLLHLRHQVTLTEAGATILPACPHFYHRPQTVRDVQMTVVDRVLDHLGLPRADTERWSARHSV